MPSGFGRRRRLAGTQPAPQPPSPNAAQPEHSHQHTAMHSPSTRGDPAGATEGGRPRLCTPRPFFTPRALSTCGRVSRLCRTAQAAVEQTAHRLRCNPPREGNLQGRHQNRHAAENKSGEGQTSSGALSRLYRRLCFSFQLARLLGLSADMPYTCSRSAAEAVRSRPQTAPPSDSTAAGAGFSSAPCSRPSGSHQRAR